MVLRSVFCGLLLGACSPLPVYSPDNIPETLAVYPLPACFVFCTSHISVMREDASSVGGGAISTGAKSNTSSSSSSNNGGP